MNWVRGACDYYIYYRVVYDVQIELTRENKLNMNRMLLQNYKM